MNMLEETSLFFFFSALSSYWKFYLLMYGNSDHLTYWLFLDLEKVCKMQSTLQWWSIQVFKFPNPYLCLVPSRSTPAVTDHAEAWPWGATSRPRSGSVTESARLLWRGSSREELPHARDQGWQQKEVTLHPRSSGCAGTGGSRGAIPCSRSGRAGMRRYP